MSLIFRGLKSSNIVDDIHYVDFYFGLERIIKIQRQRFRLGLYGVYGLSTLQTGQPTLQVSINHFDQREKSWGY